MGKPHPRTFHQASLLSSMRSTLLEASICPLIYWAEMARLLEEEPLKLLSVHQCPSLLQELEMDSLLELSTAGQPLTKLETRVNTTFLRTDAMLMEPSRSMVAKSHSKLSPILPTQQEKFTFTATSRHALMMMNHVDHAPAASVVLQQCTRR